MDCPVRRSRQVINHNHSVYKGAICNCMVSPAAVRFEVISVVMKRWPPRGYDGGFRSREKLDQQRVCNVPVITEPSFRTRL